MRSELILASQIAKHNQAFLSTDHLVPLNKHMFRDSPTCNAAVKCSRTKVTAIIVNVIGAQQKDNLSFLLNSHPFSLCIDESTDVSAEKSLSIVVKVLSGNKVKDFFYDLIEFVFEMLMHKAFTILS